MMWRVFCLELRVAFRHGADIAGPLWFFLMVITLFPLSVGPQPQLLARIAPGIIQVAALLASLLALGLRTRLQNDAGNVEGWLMLGRTGMVLGNAGTATGAYANAYRLDPKNRDAALGYAEALTRSSDPEDNRRGGELLRQLVRSDHTDIRVLSLYAFSAFEQQRFGEAVAAWEMMLKLLPAGDARRAVIERSIRLAQEK
ncbi:TPA: heme exporter protein CcmB [Salmonella enterica subsp. enterica serovar Enteritidis]